MAEDELTDREEVTDSRTVVRYDCEGEDDSVRCEDSECMDHEGEDDSARYEDSESIESETDENVVQRSTICLILNKTVKRDPCGAEEILRT
jgi:hypothetical protein